MRTKATHGARIVLGLIFFVFGLNGFLHFIPRPTEVVTGALLLSGRLVPVALVVLAPVIVNIVAFHLFLAPAGLPLPLLVVALEIFLACSYWSVYADLMRVRVSPDGVDEGRRVLASRPRDASPTDLNTPQNSEV